MMQAHPRRQEDLIRELVRRRVPRVRALRGGRLPGGDPPPPAEPRQALVRELVQRLDGPVASLRLRAGLGPLGGGLRGEEGSPGVVELKPEPLDLVGHLRPWPVSA
jgi:hypothetical protein